MHRYHMKPPSPNNGLITVAVRCYSRIGPADRAENGLVVIHTANSPLLAAFLLLAVQILLRFIFKFIFLIRFFSPFSPELFSIFICPSN